MDNPPDLSPYENLAKAFQAAPPKPLLSGPKRQHFLPRFYLDGFSRQGNLAVYDRDKNEVRMQKPEATGVIGHFYTFMDEQGRKRFEVEQVLAEQESKAAPIIQKLAARESLTDVERCDMSIFVALAMCRTPDHIDSIKSANAQMMKHVARITFSDLERVKGIIKKDKGESLSDEALEQEANALMAFVDSDMYNIDTDSQWALGMAMEMHATIAPILSARHWRVVHRATDRQSFVTADAPGVLTTIFPRKNNFYGIGFANSDAVVMFPLTASCALIMYGDGTALEHKTVGTEHIRHVNLMVADRCQRFVIGRDEALVNSIAKRLHLANKKWQPKISGR